jgi:hypothetical protein
MSFFNFESEADHVLLLPATRSHAHAKDETVQHDETVTTFFTYAVK